MRPLQSSRYHNLHTPFVYIPLADSSGSWWRSSTTRNLQGLSFVAKLHLFSDIRLLPTAPLPFRQGLFGFGLILHGVPSRCLELHHRRCVECRSVMFSCLFLFFDSTCFFIMRPKIALLKRQWLLFLDL